MLPQLGQRIMRSMASWCVRFPQQPQNWLLRYQVYKCQAVITPKQTGLEVSSRRVATFS